MFIIYITLILVIDSVLKKFIRKRYNIIERRLFRYVNNTHKWVEILLIVLAITLFVLYLFIKELVFFYSMFAIAGVVFILRAFVEYKYEREERAYIYSLIDIGSYSIIGVIVGISLLKYI